MTTDKPSDTETVVYVAVSRELLPQFREWSEPVRVRVVEEKDGVAVLELTTAASPSPRVETPCSACGRMHPPVIGQYEGLDACVVASQMANR